MPLYSILIIPTADRDLISPKKYYNLQAENLGYRFADLVEGYFNKIVVMPTASPIRYLNIRGKAMATFPYVIMFTIDEIRKTITVLRFFHARQKPLW